METATILLTVGLCLLAILLFSVYRRLGPVAGLGDVTERLEELRDRVESIASQVEQSGVHEELRGRLTEFTEAHRRMEATVTRLVQEVHAVRPLDESSDGPPENLQGYAVRHLEEAGYQKVQILEDLGEVEGLSGKVAFEAVRKGVMHKGHLMMREGVVTEENIQPVYSAFP